MRLEALGKRSNFCFVEHSPGLEGVVLDLVDGQFQQVPFLGLFRLALPGWGRCVRNFQVWRARISRGLLMLRIGIDSQQFCQASSQATFFTHDPLPLNKAHDRPKTPSNGGCIGGQAVRNWVPR